MANNKKKKGRNKIKKQPSRIETALSRANALENPLEGLEPFLDMKINDTHVKIQYYASPLPNDLLRDCMKLFEANMSDLYRNSSWGFNLGEKQQELSHENARFLIATSTDNDDLVGFAHFRFEVDEDDCPTEPVLYVHELQVALQRSGLGRRLMSVMELVALKTEMTKVMLTVFHANDSAMKFYTNKMKYTIDESSPSNYVGASADYEIMSKAVGKKK